MFRQKSKIKYAFVENMHSPKPSVLSIILPVELPCVAGESPIL